MIILMIQIMPVIGVGIFYGKVEWKYSLIYSPNEWNGILLYIIYI